MKKVKFETSLGSFTVELDEKKAPITCENFLTYVKEGFYDGTIFHRAIQNPEFLPAAPEQSSPPPPFMPRS